MFIITKILTSYLSFFYNFRIPLENPISNDEILLFWIYKIVAFLGATPTFLWLSFAAYKTYNNLKKYNIEYWIIKRYTIIAFSSIIFALSNFSTIFIPPVVGYESLNIIHLLFIASAFLLFSFDTPHLHLL